MEPTEWVGYRTGHSGKFKFYQVAYPILPEEEFDSQYMPTEYKIYMNEDDYDGKVVKASELYKVYEHKCDVSHVTSRYASRESLHASQNFNSELSTHFVPQGAEKEAYIPDRTKPDPDIKEGWRYIHQAKRDFEIAKKQVPEANYLVCFLSHQVAEKALEGLVLGFYGKYDRSKDRSWHKLDERVKALRLNLKQGTELLKKPVEGLKNYYLLTRYPDQWPNKDGIPV